MNETEWDPKRIKLPPPLQPKPRWPGWVWWILPKWPSPATRPWAVFQEFVFGIAFIIFVVSLILAPGLEAAVFTIFSLAMLVHTFLAIRWVDRNDAW